MAKQKREKKPPRYRYINAKAIRDLIRSSGRRAGGDFLQVVDSYIAERVKRACELHDGGRKTVGKYAGLYVFDTQKLMKGKFGKGNK